MVLLFLGQLALAAASPVGTWTTIDDKSGKPRAVVEIVDNGGVISGTIVKTYPEPGDTPTCEKCPGKFKNQNIVGLQFLWGLKPKGENKWAGGHILDPKIGEIYSCQITLSKDGNKLNVRGFIGFSLLGRTQVWHRNQ
ncbi:MAG: DUF2147 domain-containing protein [Gammaproteobacteria bacterium]